MSINSFLLYNCARYIRFGPDVASSLRRFQTLAIIYLYLASVTKIIIFEFSAMIFIPGSGAPILGPLAFSCSLVGLHLLRHGKSNASVIILLSYLHIGSLTVSVNQPNAALYCLFPILLVGFFLTSSHRVLIINLLASILQTANNVRGLFDAHSHHKLFNQKDGFAPYTLIIISSLTSLFLTAVGCFVQRFIENNVVKIAQLNYEKSENLTKELVKAVETQERIVSSISQDISAPFSSIASSVDSLIKTTKDVSHLKMLSKIKLSSEILQNVLNNSLSLAKLRSNKLDLSWSQTSLHEIIKKVLYANFDNLKAKEIFVHVNISNSIPNAIWVDSSKMSQIFMNLISNAVKHTPQNKQIRISATWHAITQNISDIAVPVEPFPTLNTIAPSENPLQISWQTSITRYNSATLEEFTEQEKQTRQKNFASLNHSQIGHSLDKLNGLWFQNHENENENQVWAFYSDEKIEAPRKNSKSNEIQNGYLKVEVIDAGPGIPVQDLNNIFNLFSQRTAISNTVNQRGAGLGLWICKQLCQTLGGDIKAYSKANHGSDFVFYLPIFNQNIQRSASAELVDEITALVVDDFAFNRDLHKLLLEKEGVKVTLASDGREALEIFKASGEGHFDFILTDVQMPEMDGFTSAKKMREWENETRQTQVDIYFVSGEYFNEEDVLAEFKTQGRIKETKNIWCMKKPIDLQNLRNIVQKYKDSRQKR